MAPHTPHSIHSILVVEDEASIRKALVRFLAKRFGRATGAATLLEAERHLSQEEFDALVVDLGLPDGDGLELLDATRCRRALVISSALEPARIRAAGVSEYLPKPVRLREIETCLRRIAPGLGPVPDCEVP